MTTTALAEQAAILGRLDTQWADTLPVAWPNTGFAPSGAAHIEPVLNTQQAFNSDVSTSRRVRNPGLLTLNVRVPIEGGNGVALGHADTLAAIFRNVTFSGITFRAPTIRPVGPDGSWYLVQVDCPYHRDSIY